MIVLGMSGKLGVGKNYVSDKYIIPKLMTIYLEKGFTVIPYYFSYGSFIKSELYAKDTIGDLSFYNLFVQKTSEIRHRLQTYGTDICRNNVRKDMWIRHVHMWINIQQYQLDQLPENIKNNIIPLFVIQDVRFENEYNFVKSFKNHILIRVESHTRNLIRSQFENSNAKHLSETSLDDKCFENIIHNEIDTTSDALDIEIDHILIPLLEKINLKI